MTRRSSQISMGCVLMLVGGCYVQGPPQPAPAAQPANSGGQVLVVENAPPPAQQPQVVIVEQQPQAQPQPQVVVVEPQQPPPQVVVAPPQPSLSSNFGTIALRPGFMPDPHIVTGTSGGPIAASQIGGSHCRGFITQQPDHIFVAQGGYSMLKVLAHSQQDTTLVIRRPDGGFMCNDDGGSGLNPLLQGQFAAGTYMIWIGSYRQNVRAPYRLGFTELGHVNTNSIAGNPPRPQVQVAPNYGPSNFGTVALRAGFLPDPHVVRGTSGGPMAASNLHPRCRGFITQQPDHIFIAQTQFNQMRIIARSHRDTTLIVQDAQGQVFCDDDSGGNRNPMVALRPMAAGPFRVWVGSYQRGQNARYTLGFTEMNYNSTRLPNP